MHKGVIASLVLSVLLVIFALQNTDPVTLKMWFWSFQISLALLVVILFVLGALLGYLLMVPVIWNKNKAIRDKSQQLKAATADDSMTKQKMSDSSDKTINP